jgi:hypothetical protein
VNIGIDFHDAISANPEFYKKLISKWEGKVYIVTGTPKSKRYETIKQIFQLGIYPRVDNSEYPYVFDELLMGFEYKKEEMTMDHFQKMKEHKLKLIQEHDIEVYFDDNPFYVDYLRNKGISVFQQILSDEYIDEFSKRDKYFTCHFQRGQFDYLKDGIKK